MKGQRIVTALIAAALTGGITYAYVAPIRAHNTVVSWEMQTSWTRQNEMDNEMGIIYGLNQQEKPVEVYTKMDMEGVTEAPIHLDWAHTNLNVYDRNGNRAEGWGFDREGQTVIHLTERYDAHGNCVKQSGLGTGDTVTEYTYDEKGRIISMTQTTINAQTGEVEYQSTTTQTYTDHSDGSYTVQQSDGGDLMTGIADEYDAAGNLISRHIIWDSDGRTTNYDYTYDDQNREIGVELYSDGQLRERTVTEYDVDGLISRSTTYDSTGAVIGTAESREIDGPSAVLAE